MINNINEAIQNRRSPRAFSDKKVSSETLMSLFEAARWAPSAMNEQPWLYFYAEKENSAAFNSILEVLTGINPQWAKDAQILIISVARKFYEYQHRQNQNAFHDVGAANISLAIQAAHLGLQVRQMGGFDKLKAAELLQLDPLEFEPVTVIAVGYPGNPEQLPEELMKRELQPRLRKSIEEITRKIKG